MWPPMVVLSPPTKKHTLVSFKRAIIVASGQISKEILIARINFTIGATEETQQEQQGHTNVRLVILLPPMVVLSSTTKEDTLGSFNRVIIVVSLQISSLILFLEKDTIDAKEWMQQKQRRHTNVQRVILLPLMVVLSANTKQHTLVSFNRVIIVASGQISSLVLNLGEKIKITIGVKKEMQQDKQRNHPKRAAAAVVAAAAAAVVVAAAVSQHAQLQQ